MKPRIPIADLPVEQRFRRLDTQSEYLIDLIKMIACRAETAMASLLRENMSHPDEARSLLQSLYTAYADLLPDDTAKTLTVRLHNLANYVSTNAIRSLCEELNSIETVFPGTNLKLKYELVSSQFPRSH